jgi:hypothetical protein
MKICLLPLLDDMSPRCVLCDRTFDSDEALQHHKRDSPAHAFDRTTCNRHFGSDTALVQHLRDSPIHASFFDCDDCDRSFGAAPARLASACSVLQLAIDSSTAKRFWSSICSTRPCTLNLSIVRPLPIWTCWMWLALLRLVGERRDELRIVRASRWMEWLC